MSTLSTEQRKKLPKEDFGDPEHDLYPIVDASDVGDAAALIGKAHDPAAVKSRIIGIARRKGFALPLAWQTENALDLFPRASAALTQRRGTYLTGMVLPETITIHAVHLATQQIEGYASIYGLPMRNGVLMGKAPFSQETQDLFMTNPVLLRNHNPDQVVGLVEALRQDEKGLWCQAHVDDARTWDDIVRMRIRAFSWAGSVLDYQPVPDPRAAKNDAGSETPLTMQVESADLWEISTVALPNSPQSLFAIKKAAGGALSDFTLWAPIKNVAEAARMVYGYAMVWDTPDMDGHVITREVAEPAVAEYRAFANVREMHGERAVGTATVLQVDDFGLWCGAYISREEEACWRKIQERIYRGFSIGGAALTWNAGTLAGRPVTFITRMRIDEITICDRPKVAQATFQLIKRQAGVLPSSASLTVDDGGRVQGRTMAETNPAEKNLQLELEQEKVRTGALAGAMQVVLNWIAPKKDGDGAEGDGEKGKHALVPGVSTLPPGWEQFMTETQNAAKLQAETLEKLSGTLETFAANAAKMMSGKMSKMDDEEDAKDKGDDEEAEGEAPPPFVKKGKKSANSAYALDPQFVTVFEQELAAGKTRVAAANAALSQFAGEDDAAFLALLGLGEPAANAAKPTEAEVMGQAIAHALKPLVERLDSRTAPMPRTRSLGRRSGATLPGMAQELLSANDAGTEASVWDGFAVPKGKKLQG